MRPSPPWTEGFKCGLGFRGLGSRGLGFRALGLGFRDTLPQRGCD